MAQSDSYEPFPDTSSLEVEGTISALDSIAHSNGDTSEEEIFDTLKLVLSELLPDISPEFVSLIPFSSSFGSEQSHSAMSSDPLSLAQSFWIRIFSLFLSVCDHRCSIENSLTQLYDLCSFIGQGDESVLTMCPSLGVALDVIVQRVIYELSDKIVMSTKERPAIADPDRISFPATICGEAASVHAMNLYKCISIMSHGVAESCCRIEGALFSKYFPQKYCQMALSGSSHNNASISNVSGVDEQLSSSTAPVSSICSRTQKLTKQLREALAWSSCKGQLPNTPSHSQCGAAADGASVLCNETEDVSNSNSSPRGEVNLQDKIFRCDGILRDLCGQLLVPNEIHMSIHHLRNDLERTFEEESSQRIFRMMENASQATAIEELKPYEEMCKSNSVEGDASNIDGSVTRSDESAKSSSLDCLVETSALGGTVLLGSLSVSLASAFRSDPNSSLNSKVVFVQQSLQSVDVDFSVTLNGLHDRSKVRDGHRLRFQNDLEVVDKLLWIDTSMENSIKHLKACMKEMKNQMGVFLKEFQGFLNNHFRKCNRNIGSDSVGGGSHGIIRLPMRPQDTAGMIAQIINTIQGNLGYVCEVGDRLIEIMSHKFKNLRNTTCQPTLSPFSRDDSLGDVFADTLSTGELRERLKANKRLRNDFVTLKTLKNHVEVKRWLCEECAKLNDFEGNEKKKFMKLVEQVLCNAAASNDNNFGISGGFKQFYGPPGQSNYSFLNDSEMKIATSPYAQVKYFMHPTRYCGVHFNDGRMELANSLIQPLPKHWGCNIGINEDISICQKRLWNLYVEFDTSMKIRDFFMALLYFGRVHQVCDSERGTISPQGWLVLALHVLLKHEYVPNLHEEPDVAETLCPRISPFHDIMLPLNFTPSVRKVPIEEREKCLQKIKNISLVRLLELFFRYVTEDLDMLGSVITVRGNGVTFPKETWVRGSPVMWRICIEDPFATSIDGSMFNVPMDLGASMTRPGQVQFLKAIRRAAFGLTTILVKDREFCGNMLRMLFNKDELLELARLSGYNGAAAVTTPRYVPNERPTVFSYLSRTSSLTTTPKESPRDMRLLTSRSSNADEQSLLSSVGQLSTVNSMMTRINLSDDNGAIRRHPNVPVISLSSLNDSPTYSSPNGQFNVTSNNYVNLDNPPRSARSNMGLDRHLTSQSHSARPGPHQGSSFNQQFSGVSNMSYPQHLGNLSSRSDSALSIGRRSEGLDTTREFVEEYEDDNVIWSNNTPGNNSSSWVAGGGSLASSNSRGIVPPLSFVGNNGFSNLHPNSARSTSSNGSMNADRSNRFLSSDLSYNSQISRTSPRNVEPFYSSHDQYSEPNSARSVHSSRSVISNNNYNASSHFESDNWNAEASGYRNDGYFASSRDTSNRSIYANEDFLNRSSTSSRPPQYSTNGIAVQNFGASNNLGKTNSTLNYPGSSPPMQNRGYASNDSSMMNRRSNMSSSDASFNRNLNVMPPRSSNGGADNYRGFGSEPNYYDSSFSAPVESRESHNAYGFDPRTSSSTFSRNDLSNGDSFDRNGSRFGYRTNSSSSHSLHDEDYIGTDSMNDHGFGMDLMASSSSQLGLPQYNSNGFVNINNNYSTNSNNNSTASYSNVKNSSSYSLQPPGLGLGLGLSSGNNMNNNNGNGNINNASNGANFGNYGYRR